MRRRDLLKAGGALGAGPLWAPGLWGDPPEPAGRTFTAAQWRTLTVVQEHLLPSEPDAPGAGEINATAYLDRALAGSRFDPEVRTFLLKGIGWLDDYAQEQEGRSFAEIPPARREELLQGIAESRAGENWLSTLISYTLEALLADPIYGGNPDGIGWAWLDHDPGRPRPTAANKVDSGRFTPRRSES